MSNKERINLLITWTDSNKLLLTICLFATIILFLFLIGILLDFKNIFCKCSHIKSHHKESMKDGIRSRGECEQWDCDCEKFE